MTSSSHDFDVGGDRSLWEFAERLESLLESRGMTSQLRQLCVARSARSRRRDVILSRTNRDEVLNFHVAGGLDKGGGVFVAKVEPDSKPYLAGLRCGDQVSTIYLLTYLLTAQIERTSYLALGFTLFTGLSIPPFFLPFPPLSLLLPVLSFFSPFP